MTFINAFPGLSSAEFADIHGAVLEAMGFVLRPAIFYVPNTDNVDDLYAERTSDHSEDETALAEIGASVRYKPDGESLTRMGLKVEATVLLFIPRGEVQRWEAAQSKTFLPSESGWEVRVQGKRFNVLEVQTDPLPVGDGSTEDYIGMVVTGYKEK